MLLELIDSLEKEYIFFYLNVIVLYSEKNDMRERKREKERKE